jgi:hypothetical protein
LQIAAFSTFELEFFHTLPQAFTADVNSSGDNRCLEIVERDDGADEAPALVDQRHGA